MYGQDFLSLFTSDKRISDCGKPYKQPPRDCVRFRADRKVLNKYMVKPLGGRKAMTLQATLQRDYNKKRAARAALFYSSSFL